jgi:hypothetical protein
MALEKNARRPVTNPQDGCFYLDPTRQVASGPRAAAIFAALAGGIALASALLLTRGLQKAAIRRAKFIT